MKKKEVEETKKPYKKYKKTSSTYKKKETDKKKKKEVYLCSKCLEEVTPSTLQWVSVTDQFGCQFQILICDDCLEKKDEYISRYETFEVVRPLYKKREYKKKKKDA